MLGVDLMGPDGEHLRGSPDGLKSEGFFAEVLALREGAGLARND